MTGMELHQYQFELSDLSIDNGDIERLMGYEPGECPDPFRQIIEEVSGELSGHCRPQGGYIILEGPEFDLGSNRTIIQGQTFLTDKIVTRMLRRSESLALFVCTAGDGIESWKRELNGSGDPVKGFVIDSFGSEVAEAAAQKLHSIVKEQVKQTNKLITNRYSPGYCDWPVRDQQKLFGFFPERFCGITLSASSLMHPIKSVSGMIGIGSQVRYQMYTCDSCKDEHCIYRRLQKTAPG
jgi:hypothetical protein